MGKRNEGGEGQSGDLGSSLITMSVRAAFTEKSVLDSKVVFGHQESEVMDKLGNSL